MWLFDEIKNIPDIVRYWAAKTPDKIALIDGEVTRTYAELDRRSNSLANRMLQMGIRPGANIGFLGKNTLEFYEVWFAACKIACPIAPFNWRSPAEELAGLVADAKPPVIFASAEFADVLREIEGRTPGAFVIVPFGSGEDRLAAWIGAAAATPVQLPLALADVALLTYTSGTTGRPKGVQANQEAFQYSFLCTSLEPALSLRTSDIIVMTLPNFHLGGNWVCLGALYHGGAVTMIPAFDPELFVKVLRRDRPTIVPLVPTAIQMLLNRPDFSEADYSSIRSILYFGSPIGRELLDLARKKLGCEFSQFYGATEAWFLTILNHKEHIDAVGERLASCGVALPLVSLKVVDAAGKEVANGTVGEILARTPMMFAGYFGQPEATKAAFHDGWYHTGDLGRRDDDGFFYVVDRAKDMIISGGENVYSAEVESALLKYPGVAAAAVLGAPDPKWGEKVIALVILGANAKVDEAALKEHCRKYLAGYKVPKEIHFEASLPMTPTGKIQKAVLRKRYRE